MKEEKQASKWGWLAEQMPGVSRLMADKRAEVGADWVKECWKRGVLMGEPGWFFAGEGSLMVGTLWGDAEVLAFASAKVTRTQALLVLKVKGAADGAH